MDLRCGSGQPLAPDQVAWANLLQKHVGRSTAAGPCSFALPAWPATMPCCKPGRSG